MYELYKGAWINRDESNERALSRSEAKELLKKGGLFVRNVFNFDTSQETSFWYVIKDSFGGLEELSSGARRDVRKSLRVYDIVRLSIDDIVGVGYDIFASAQESYKVKCDVFTKEQFIQITDSYRKDQSKEYWGVVRKDNGEVVAIGINTIKNNSCEYNTLKCKPSALRDGSQPYYGLIYEMNRHYLDERKLSYVNDGARSITNHSNIQPFLISKFKFRKAYCNINIFYTWWMKVIVCILFPFRKYIPIAKVKSILNMEAMVRGKI